LRKYSIIKGIWFRQEKIVAFFVDPLEKVHFIIIAVSYVGIYTNLGSVAKNQNILQNR